MSNRHLTHMDLCLAATEWAISQRWAALAAPEVSLSWAAGGGIADVLAVGWDPMSVRVIECKRTRADLVSDLRRGKMTGPAYASASHHYLALGPEVFRDQIHNHLDELTEWGLPKNWGVLAIGPASRGRPYVYSVRPCRSRATKTREVVDNHARALGRSLTWRLLRREHYRHRLL